MTAVKTVVGEKLLIQIGNGATPVEVFSHDCLINLDRSFALTADATDVIVPDCDAPEQVGFKQRFIDGLSGDISGSGLLHTTSIKAWNDWLISAAGKNCRVNVNVSNALGGGYWAASFKLQSFSISGPRKNLCTVDVQMVSDGVIAWVPA